MSGWEMYESNESNSLNCMIQNIDGAWFLDLGEVNSSQTGLISLLFVPVPRNTSFYSVSIHFTNNDQQMEESKENTHTPLHPTVSGQFGKLRLLPTLSQDL